MDNKEKVVPTFKKPHSRSINVRGVNKVNIDTEKRDDQLTESFHLQIRNNGFFKKLPLQLYQ